MSHNGLHINIDELIQLRTTASKLQLSPSKKIINQQSGEYISRLHGRGIEFDEVRPYQCGDDIRSMDWRITARTGKPHTKLFHEDRERPIFIVVDYSQSMFFGTRVAYKSVIASQTAAILAWSAVFNGDKVGAVLFSHENHTELKPRGRAQGILPLLKKISEYSKAQQAKQANFTEGLTRLRQVVTKGSLIFLISDFHELSVDAAQHLHPISQHNEVIACAIYDPLEINAPPPNYYRVTNGEQYLAFDSSNQRVRHQYAEQFKQRQNTLKSNLQKHNIPVINIVSDQPLLTSLNQGLLRKTRGQQTYVR